MNQGSTSGEVNSLSDDLPHLIRRHIEGELKLHEVDKLADLMWRSDEADRRFMGAVLSEPPEPQAIIAPRELSRILKTLVSEYETRTDSSSEETIRLDVLKMRLEICLCLDSETPRRVRLGAILNGLAKLPAGKQPIAAVNRMWLAEIAYRLVKEFEKTLMPAELEALAGLGRISILAQAPFCRSFPEFQLLLRQFCHFTCCLGIPGEGEPDRNGWETTLGESLSSFKVRGIEAFDSDEETRLPDETGESMKTVLLLVYAAMRQDRDALEVWSREVETRTNGFFDDADEIGELFLTLVTIGRSYASRGKPPVPVFSAVLCALRAKDIRLSARRAHMRSRDSAQLLRNLQGQMELLLVASRTPEQQARLEQFNSEIAAVQPPHVEIDANILARAIDEALTPKQTGRRGLALSGGGFRAACFHLGVFACLADRDMLRQMDVLSCVSGGAIAGAAYAVRVKALLASKHDLEITEGDYRAVVADLIEAFEHLMGMNLRAAAFRSPKAIVRMWLRPNYTFTERIADLLDTYLFAPLLKSHPDFRAVDRNKLAEIARLKKGHTQPISLPRGPLLKAEAIGWPLAPWDLRDAPYCESHDFDLNTLRNDVRRAKCPELFINTTSLNTGGPFLFSTSGNGEPWDLLKKEISSRPTIRWRGYSDLNSGGQFDPSSFRLSRIVAASASVPGLLPPVIFQRTTQAATLALADGGICDNQGFSALISGGCEWVLASDAAGQLRFEAYPEVANFEVITHSTNILMERIREMSYSAAVGASKKDSGIEFLTLHLTRGLVDPPPKAMFDLDESLDAMRREVIATHGTTGFGVSSMYQRALANMRTDLDCFSALEVHCLMASGYLQASTVLGPAAADQEGREKLWKFMQVAPDLASTDADGRLLGVLCAARSRFLRLPRLLVGRMRRSSLGVATLFFAGAIVTTGVSLAMYLILFQPTIPAGVDETLKLGVSYALLLFLIHQLPPTSTKRWLWKFSSGPFLVAAMLYALMVLYVADPIYRRLCKFEPS